jgi:SAM-dependent methyltransferase
MNASRNGRTRGEARRRRGYSARTADRHVLYEMSVQCPEAEVRFFDRVYRNTYGREPTVLREDFCGTAAVSCEWIRTRAQNTAIGIDLDPPVLAWSREHNVPKLGPAARRLTLVRGDVRRVRTAPVEIVVAMNFSYFTFKARKDLLRYFRAVHRSLRREGLFFLDIMGGPEAQVPQLEELDYGDYVYVWDQDKFNPITHECRFYIHFKFPDGTKMWRAFSYDWRLWSTAEVRDALLETGFRSVDVYWEGASANGEGNGVFRVTRKGDNSPAWVGYVVARP